ncbi:MAG TPA: hypothetical protein VKG92_09925 [Flavobacteriales bacterium]|nr:hypothetical protein [Flavobacteriales bacterium]
MRVGYFLAYAALSLVTMKGNAQVADAGPDTTLCVDFYTLQGSPLPVGAFGVWTMVSGCGTSTNPNDPVQLVTNLCVGTSIWEWTVDDGGSITTDAVGITMFDAGAPVANAGPDQSVMAPPGTAVLNANPYQWPQQCQWSIAVGSGILADPTDPFTTITGLSPGMNLLVWTCFNGPCGVSSDLVGINAFVWTGIQGAMDQEAPQLHYNPSSAMLTFDGTLTLDALEVLDPAGRIVQRLATNMRSWDLSELPHGLYVVRAIANGHVGTLRCVVTH